MPSPNADAASRSADATASASSSGACTTRMPRPPPPNAALTSTGYPTVSPAAITSSPAVTVAPGRTGTPACSMSALAASFEPMASIASGVGPTKVTPASAHARANGACSDRNP